MVFYITLIHNCNKQPVQVVHISNTVGGELKYIENILNREFEIEEEFDHRDLIDDIELNKLPCFDVAQINVSMEEYNKFTNNKSLCNHNGTIFIFKSSNGVIKDIMKYLYDNLIFD